MLVELKCIYGRKLPSLMPGIKKYSTSCFTPFISSPYKKMEDFTHPHVLFKAIYVHYVIALHFQLQEFLIIQMTLHLNKQPHI
jgi:hypothetical protein